VKILHVIPSLALEDGGPTHAMIMMEKALSGQGVEVTTATTWGKNTQSLHDLHGFNGNVRRYYGSRWTTFYKFSPSLFFWLLRHCREYEVVHIHALFSFSSLAAAVAALWHGVPYVIRPLGTLSRYGVSQHRPLIKSISLRLVEGPLIRRASAIHFTSRIEEAEADSYNESPFNIVIPLAVEMPAEITEVCPFEADDGQLVILYLSRLDPKKNIEGLISAFGLLAPHYPTAKLIVVGDGPDEFVQSLKLRAEANGVAERIDWTGYLEGMNKWAALARADIFVLPSFSENFGIAAAEALMAGKACLLGEGVALSEDVRREKAGLVTEAGVDSIVANLKLLMENAELRRQLGERARRFSEQSFSPDKMAVRLIDLYKRIVADARAVG
jgi:glycosyltransferase involved in cell wall biosynthesis